MTRILLLLVLLTATAAAQFLANSTYGAKFVTVRDLSGNSYTYLYPPQGYLCVYRNGYYVNVNDALFFLEPTYVILNAYAWRGSARFCDSAFSVCYTQSSFVYPLPTYAIIDDTPRVLYIFDSKSNSWVELTKGTRVGPGVIAAISPRGYTANLTFIDTLDGVVKTAAFNVKYFITSAMTQERDYAICLRVNTTYFPFYSTWMKGIFIPVYTVKQGNAYYALRIFAGTVTARGYVYSSVGYFSLLNHTTFMAADYIFVNDSNSIWYSPLSGSFYYMPLDTKFSGSAFVSHYGTYLADVALYTERYYAYYSVQEIVYIMPSGAYLAGENNTIVVMVARGDGGKMSYATFPLCSLNKGIFYVRLFPEYSVDIAFKYGGAAWVLNNSTKTLYVMLAFIMRGRLLVYWTWRIPPGEAAVIPASSGSPWAGLYYTLDAPCTGNYVKFSLIPGHRYVFDGAVFSIVDTGNQTEWIELFNQLLKLLLALHNQTSTVVREEVLERRQGYTYSGQSVVNVATSLSTSTQLQNVYAFSIASQGAGISAGGVNIPIASIALALLLAFAVAVGVAKTREDPADRLAAVYAVFVPTVVMLSLFFASDLATAAVTAAALLALAYAIHAARL